jgi:hypothetical protein
MAPRKKAAPKKAKETSPKVVVSTPVPGEFIVQGRYVANVPPPDNVTVWLTKEEALRDKDRMIQEVPSLCVVWVWMGDRIEIYGMDGKLSAIGSAAVINFLNTKLECSKIYSI